MPPRAWQEAQRLLSKLGPEDVVESFLYVCEQTALSENWAENEWALAPLLSGKDQRPTSLFLLRW